MDVRIVQLEPVRVASVLGYGTEPEMLAWDKLLTWAEAHTLNIKAHRCYGFNNPSPAPGSPNYGYEVWMVLDESAKSDSSIVSEGETTVKGFAGGKYAVARHTGVEGIHEAWMQLSAWLETSPYRMANHQWLEEHINIGRDVPPEAFVLDLYMPVKDSAERG